MIFLRTNGVREKETKQYTIMQKSQTSHHLSKSYWDEKRKTIVRHVVT